MNCSRTLALGAAVVASWNRALRSILEELGDDLRGLAGGRAPSPPGAGDG